MNTEEIISRLKQEVNFFQVQHKTSFLCHRTDKNGNDQVVQVDIFDAGPDASQNRYYCRATTEDGKLAVGNPESSIKLLLMGVHWQNLD